MARALTAALLAAIQAGTVRPAVFYEGEFESGFARLWSGYGTYSWNGQSWLGAGELLAVAPIAEGSDVRAVGFSVSLSGEVTGNLAAAIGYARQGLPGRVWLGCFDAAGALIADPFKCFDGRFDTLDIADDGARCTITCNYESRLIDLDRARDRRWTHEDQQISYAGDLGFQYVNALQGAAVPWARIDPAAIVTFNQRLRAGAG